MSKEYEVSYKITVVVRASDRDGAASAAFAVLDELTDGMYELVLDEVSVWDE